MSAGRGESIDQFRRLTIILGVIVNYLSGVRIVPAWLKHAPGVGLTSVDIIAPAFLFAIGLTYRTSSERRLERDGRSTTIRHFLTRWFAVVGIGAILQVGQGLTGQQGMSQIGAYCRRSVLREEKEILRKASSSAA